MLQTLMLKNFLVFTPFLSYVITQILKTLLYLCMTKKFDVKRLFGSGGMPSSHSAMVSSLFIAALRKCGAESPVTAAILIFAVIVIYDARGVRQQTGRHAQLLNLLFRKEEYAGNSNIQLNEMVGHTGLQVFAGVLLGAFITLCIPVF